MKPDLLAEVGRVIVRLLYPLLKTKRMLYSISTAGTMIVLTDLKTGKAKYFTGIIETTSKNVRFSSLANGKNETVNIECIQGYSDTSSLASAMLAMIAPSGAGGGSVYPVNNLEPKVIDLQAGTFTLADIITANSAIGVASFAYALKGIGGGFVGGGQSTTAEATMTGPIGDANLDAGSSVFIGKVLNNDGTWRQLAPTQSFTVAAGSAARIVLELIK